MNVLSDFELAHSKQAIQSGTYLGFGASRAVDGNETTYSLAAVDGGSSEIGWWQVDLGGAFQVSGVTIVNANVDYGNVYILRLMFT